VRARRLTVCPMHLSDGVVDQQLAQRALAGVRGPHHHGDGRHPRLAGGGGLAARHAPSLQHGVRVNERAHGCLVRHIRHLVLTLHLVQLIAAPAHPRDSKCLRVPHAWEDLAGRVDTPASPVLPLEGAGRGGDTLARIAYVGAEGHV
jgi:hypothetical protein